jgi:hypothetical protein
MRLGTRLCGGFVLALVLAGSAPGSMALESATDPLVTVRYSGSLDARAELHATHPRGPDVHESHIQWSLSWSGRLSKLKAQASHVFATQRLTGTVRYVDRINPGSVTGRDRSDCTGTYSAKPGTKVPVVVTVDPDNRKGFGVQLTRPTSGTYLVSSNKRSNWDFCTRIFAGVLPSSSKFVSPLLVFSPKGGKHPRKLQHNEALSAESTTRTTVDEVVTVTVGGATTSTSVDIKRVARDDLRRALERAKGPCLHLAISLGVITSGAVWTSVGAPLPGGIPAGGSLIATGAVMGGAVAPLCSELIKQIVVSYSIYKKDPPVPKLATQVKLPSCGRWEGKVRAYCVELSAAVERLAAAEGRVLPILKRLQGAGTRLSAARARGDTRGVEAANEDVRDAAAALRTTRAAVAAAGSVVGRVVSAAGVQGKLTKAESERVVDALLGELARHGVPAAELRKAAPAALASGSIDVLAALGA